MKRTMIVVVVALMPALLFGMYNTGYQVGMTGWAAFGSVSSRCCR